jgi:alpha-L-fucosidase
MSPKINRRNFLKTAAATAALSQVNLLRGQPFYQPTWESLARHPEPAWFQDAKFGIYFHWSAYAVPAFDNEWYSRNLYIPGQRANTYHNLVYGPPSKFGYKDFIPMFRGEKYNPQEWAQLLRRAGAKFAGPVTEHADGFSLWDSRVNEWNAARMGPSRDVVGELARALRNEGLRFLATFHHQWLWGWYPTADKSVDAGNPQYSGLYGPYAPGSPFKYQGEGPYDPPPTLAFQDKWEAKVREVIDKYQPDHLYFDSRLNVIDKRHLTDLFAYYYNQSDRWGKEIGASYKLEDLPKGVAMLDVEGGRLGDIATFKWLTDDSIDWNSWCNVQNPHYKSANRIIDELVDIVSKNGNLLLDITPTADGVMPEPVVERLLAVGRWLEVNGEAIYGTRPWKIYGEGPTKIHAGTFGESETPDFTARDIRFTSSGKTLYAIAMDWPGDGADFVIPSLSTHGGRVANGEIAHVSLLGSQQKPHWKHDEAGLTIILPQQKPGDFAYAFKILLM